MLIQSLMIVIMFNILSLTVFDNIRCNLNTGFSMIIIDCPSQHKT